MKLTSKDGFIAEVTDGLLLVTTVKERALTVITSEGESTVPYSKISPAMSASPILAATWAGDGYANVDSDCGAKRWNGSKPMRWIRTGLCNAGFLSEEINSIFREMRKVGPQNSVRRYS